MVFFLSSPLPSSTLSAQAEARATAGESPKPQEGKPADSFQGDGLPDLLHAVAQDLKRFIQYLADQSPIQPGNQIHFYLRNNSGHDLILTDLVNYLDKDFFHYHFSIEQPEILFQDTIQKFTVSNLPQGAHHYQLNFLIYELPITPEPKKQTTRPIKPCSLLSDAYCLHRLTLPETRERQECSFNFSLKEGQALSIIISFNDSSTPQMLALPSSGQEKYQVELEIAKRFFQNQQFLPCLSTLSNIEKNYPDFSKDKEMLFLKGECFFHLKMYREATNWYQQVQKHYPKNAYNQLILLRLIMIHYLADEHTLVMNNYQQLSRLVTDHSILEPARYLTALSYYKQDLYTQAAKLLESIPTSSPYYLEACYLQSDCYFNLKEFSLATDSLRKITSTDHAPSSSYIRKEMLSFLSFGTNPEALRVYSHLWLGKILYHQALYQEALPEFEAIPQTSPHYISALIGQGLIFLRQNQKDKLKAIMKELGPNTLENQFLAEARLTLALQQNQKGDVQTALGLLQETIKGCETGLVVLEGLKTKATELEELVNALFSSPSPSLSLELSWLVQELQEDKKINQFLAHRKTLFELEQILGSMDSLLFEPMHINMMSQKLAQDSLSLKEPSFLIEGQREKIQYFQKDLLSQLSNSVQAFLQSKVYELKEIKERTNLEAMMITHQREYAQVAEERFAAYSKALGQIAQAQANFLDQYPKSPYREKILFQLAENYYQQANTNFQLQLRDAEKKNNPADYLAETKPDLDQAIELYEKMLLEFPGGHYGDKVLYALGYAYYEQGAVILSKDIFQEFAEKYPAHPLAPEVLLRLGEISFEANSFAEAMKYYNQSIQSVQSVQLPPAYKNNILYKLAWSYYQQNQYKKAFDLFISLADHYLQTNNTALLKEICSQLAKIFSEYDSLDQAKALFPALEGKSYHLDILEELAKLLLDQGKIEESVAMNQRAIELHPLHSRAPILQNRIEKAYVMLNNLEAANTAREKLITVYGENTPWWKENRDERVKKEVTDLIDESIRNSTIYLIESQDKEEYQKIIEFYRENINHLPTTRQVYTINFFLAECLFKTGQFEKSLPEYEKISAHKEFNEFNEEAAYKRILCLEKILTQKAKEISAQASSHDWKPEEKQFMSACDSLAEHYPQHQHLPEVLYKKGELLAQKGQEKEAIASLTPLLETSTEETIRLAALKLMAKIHFNQHRFDLAGQLYSQVVDNYSLKLKEKGLKDQAGYQAGYQNAYEMMALAKLKEAEILKTTNPLQAAWQFEETAKNLSSLQMADGALFEAAKLYQANDQLDKAQQIFLRIFEKYPRSIYAPQSLLAMAQYEEKTEQWLLAAQNYEKLSLNYPDFIEARKSLYKAGLLYEKVENWAKMVKIFQRLQAFGNHQPEAALEIAFRRGYALMKSGDFEKAEASFHVVGDMYERYKKQNPSPSPYYPAWSQFLISERIFETYAQTSINKLNDQDLESKVTLASKVIENYTKTAEFGVAEWSTVSYYKMGSAMDDLAEQIEKLSATEVEKNDEALYLIPIQSYQKAIEFFQKAILLHQKNLSLAQKSYLADQWIERSGQQMTKDFWKIGDLNEKVYTLLKEAPVPDFLNADEQIEYEQALLLKAQPFQKQAIEMYEKNTKVFLQKIAFNPWIELSYKRLAELLPQKYRRDELELMVDDDSYLGLPTHLLGN